MRKLKTALVLFCIFQSGQLFSQRTPIAVADVWQKYSFVPAYAQGFNYMQNSQFYTLSEGNKIYKNETITGNNIGLIAEIPIKFSSYTFSTTEDKILLLNERESIYRRSFRAEFYVYDIKNKQNKKVSPNGKQSYATLSPDGSRVAFARDNNLFVVDLATMQETAITSTGKTNEIIHGSTDWVYEEELSFVKAFFWSPDSKKIAFYTFDESQVKEYNMQLWKKPYPADYRFKYPKAGEKNSVVSLSCYDLPSKTTKRIDLGTNTDIYVARVEWTKTPNLLSIRTLNRLQNTLELLHADVEKNTVQSIYKEIAKDYIDIEFNEDLIYLKNGKEFILCSEKDGFKHLYLYQMNGKASRQITKGSWEMSKVEGFDEKNRLIYFTSTKASPLERNLYMVSLDKGTEKVILDTKGTHDITMSEDCKYFVDDFSTANTPAVTSLYEISGKKIKDLENNQALNEKLRQYQISPKEFIKIPVSGVELNAWTIKPQNFNPQNKYPVLMFVYGGPGSQQVKNDWDTYDYFWYQHLVSQGYVIVCVDNRGTGGRGAAFRKMTYGQLGKLEVEDQIQAAKYLATQPYVDKNRIGIWGWSYGGYMAANCILQGADVFKAAISVAPVTNWRFYDTIYTERYLGLPQDNPKGYDDNSPLSHASKLKGKFLLIHGTSDDNVHFQNAVEMQNALIAAGKQFDTFYYPNKNHGIYGGNTRMHLYEMMTNFWIKNL